MSNENEQVEVVDATLTPEHAAMAVVGVSLIVGYLQILLPVYSVATADQKEELLQHNPTLNAIIQTFREAGITI